jgi:putative PIN family toxin of toxin-antitoxin system
MKSADPEKVVFDCNVFAQALINIRGPAGTCLSIAQSGGLILYVSEYVLQEIRELPSKIKPKLGITPERVERLIQDVAKYAITVNNVPSVYKHPIDPDDSHYIDLAVATNSEIIASRDRHLHALMDEKQPLGQSFKILFPTIVVMNPETLLERLRQQNKS